METVGCKPRSRPEGENLEAGRDSCRRPPPTAHRLPVEFRAAPPRFEPPPRSSKAMMPRKSSKTKGGLGPAAADPYPNPAHPAHEYPCDAEGSGSEPDGAVDALQRLDLDVSASTAAKDAPAETPPPPQPEFPAPRPPPMGASPSRSAAVGGGPEEDGLRRLQELVGIGREKVELTEEEVRANDQRQEDEICALEAIFGDNVVMLNRKEGQRSFQSNMAWK